ncbi:hypothetical protein D3C72_2104740 [compost metagenome]
MSCAIRKPSRDRPSKKLPAMASRGAKPMLCTKPSNLGHTCARSANMRSICSSLPTSQSKMSLESNSAAKSVMRSLKRSPT